MTTILIIDDSLEMGRLFKEMVSLLGYHVVVSDNGASGLEMLRSAEPDVILLDVMMPGMNGWQVYEEIRLISTTPVIFLTADYTSKNISRASAMGARMIRKDIKPLDLKRQIETALQTQPD